MVMMVRSRGAISVGVSPICTLPCLLLPLFIWKFLCILPSDAFTGPLELLGQLGGVTGKSSLSGPKVWVGATDTNSASW